MAEQPSGHIRTIPRKRGATYYAKLKLPDGSEPQRRLGLVWTKRSNPPDGYLTRRQAEARLAAMLAGEDETLNIAPSHVTLAQACDERIRYLRDERRRKKSTLLDATSVMRGLKAHFGADTPVEDITTADVEALKVKLLASASPRTAQRKLVILHGVMARAHKLDWIKTNPCADAEKVVLTPSDTFNILEPEQVYALERAAVNPTIGALFVVGAFTGLRCPGELTSLRWQHVDFANRIVHVWANFTRGEESTTKGKRRRSVPLSDQAMVALDKLSRRGSFSAPNDLVFCTETGERLSGATIRDAFYEAITDADLGHLRWVVMPTDEDPKGTVKNDPIIPYDLRHTFGSLAVRTAPLSDVQTWMGHQDITTTMKYIHYVPQHDAAAKLSAAFAPAQIAEAIGSGPGR